VLRPPFKLLFLSREKCRDHKAVVSVYFFVDHDEVFAGLCFFCCQKFAGFAFVDCVGVFDGLQDVGVETCQLGV